MKTILLKNGLTAMVDDDDHERIAQYRWYLKNGYAARYVPVSARGKADWHEVYMHHEVLQQNPTGSEWHLHHVNENRLDNRRANLVWRTVPGHRHEHRSTWDSAKLNAEGKRRIHPGPRYKGVSWHARFGVWQAMIMVNGKALYLGQYKIAEEAAIVYDAAVLCYRGGRGFLNLLNSDTT